jgi:hypothetical protein
MTIPDTMQTGALPKRLVTDPTGWLGWLCLALIRCVVSESSSRPNKPPVGRIDIFFAEFPVIKLRYLGRWVSDKD